MDIAETDLAPIRALYDNGKYLSAYRAAHALAPLGHWTGTAARLLAGRIALQVGGVRLGRWQHVRAYRRNPDDAEAAYYFARYLHERQGPFAAWTFIRAQTDWPDAASDLRADWFVFGAFVAARLRDVDRAEAWFAKAEKLYPERAWIWVERSTIHEFNEKLPEALAAAEHALRLRPGYRPALQATAHILERLNRPHDAIALLEPHLHRIESALLVGQYATLLLGQQRYADVLPWLDRLEELSPLLDKETRFWLAARRTDAAYFAGDLALAKHHVGTVEPNSYHARLAPRLLAAAAPGPRGQLPAPTLPPTTAPLTYVCSFWNCPGPSPNALPVDTLCADAVPTPDERRWAEQAGWRVHEFTLSLPIARALLERGMPFLLTVVDGGFSQTEAVFGYDALRDSLFTAQADGRAGAELDVIGLSERFAACGPRCTLVLPTGQAHRLDGLELPDAKLYDELYRLQAALAIHDRGGAGEAFAALTRQAPGHRLTRQARALLARHDGQPDEQMAAIAGLLELFPHDSTLNLAKAALLRDRGGRDERIAHLRALTDLPNAEPVFLQNHAQALLVEPPSFWMARQMIRSAIEQRPQAASAYFVYANLLWELRDFSTAVEAYRVAACLDDRDDQLPLAYFRAARMEELTGEATRFLQARFQRNVTKATGPTRVLFQALCDRDAVPEAFAALEHALKQRPEDGDLLAFAAERHAEFGRAEPAKHYLAAAEGKLPRVRWLRSAAHVSLVQAKFTEALTHWQAIVAAEPLALDGHRAVARLLSDAQGRSAAIAYLEATCARHPACYALQQILLEWLRGGRPMALETLLRRLCARWPLDAGTRRELAVFLAETGRGDEALTVLRQAADLDSNSAAYHLAAAQIHRRAGRVAEARVAAKASLQAQIDNEAGVAILFSTRNSRDEKLAELEFLEAELRRQPHTGEGLLAYREQALSLLEPDELLERLQSLREDYPNLGLLWSMEVQQLALVGRLDEALSLAREGTERFPLYGRLWFDLAEVYHLHEDNESRLEALRSALQAVPGWGLAARELSEALEEDKQKDKALALLQATTARSPFDPVNHGYLAETSWNNDQPEPALAELATALKFDPGYEWAWRTLADWADRMDEHHRVAEVARAVTAARPGDARAWVAQARLLTGPKHTAETLAALDKALALDPQQIEACDLKAERLAELDRFEEALKACRPPDWQGELPMILRGRMAWIEARRGNYAAAIPPMQKLVADVPEYYWGWQQLADWYNETNRPAAYLEAAAELVRLRPDSPVALAKRGEARLQTGDRSGGKDDLRKALQMAPNYQFAGIALFDAFLADNELNDAAKTLPILQEHVGDAFVLARQTQLACRQSDQGGALEALKQVAGAPSESDWPVSAAAAACRSAGWTAETDTALAEVWQAPEPFHPATVLVWLDGAAGQAAALEEKLRALDAAIATAPRYLPAHDAKIELLARNGQFDAAELACNPTVLAGNVPYLLQGRAAWLKAVRGDRAGAIAQMQGLLDRHPDFFWGWQQLATWLESAQQSAEYLKAAEQMVRLAPNEPVALGFRGEARRQTGDRLGAKADFRKAFEADPKYGFAGQFLFDELLEDKNYDEAAITLATLRQHNDGPLVRLRAVQLAAKRHDQTAALDSLRGLLTDTTAPAMLVRKALEVVQEAGWSAGAERLLDELLAGPDAAPQVGRLWVLGRLGRGEWAAVEERLTGWFTAGELGTEALLAYLEMAGKAEHAQRLRACLEKFTEPLRCDLRLWGQAGSALVAIRNYALAVEWMRDWPERENVPPVIFINLVLALRALGRPEEAHRVSVHALQADIPDYTTPLHAVWLLFDVALTGPIEGAGTALTNMEMRALDPYHLLVYRCAEAVLLVRKMKAPQRSPAFAQAQMLLNEAVAQAPSGYDPVLALVYRATVTAIRQTVGTFGAWWWSVGQWWAPPSFARET